MHHDHIIGLVLLAIAMIVPVALIITDRRKY